MIIEEFSFSKISIQKNDKMKIVSSRKIARIRKNILEKITTRNRIKEGGREKRRDKAILHISFKSVFTLP